MTTDNFCFYLQNRLIQTSQTGGQWYSDTSPFSIPWTRVEMFSRHAQNVYKSCKLNNKKFYRIVDKRNANLLNKNCAGIHKTSCDNITIILKVSSLTTKRLLVK